MNRELAMARNHAIHLGIRRLWRHCITGDACESPKMLAATIGSLICEFGERRVSLEDIDEIEDMKALAKIAADVVAREALRLTAGAASLLLTRTPKAVWSNARRLELEKQRVLETVLAHHEHSEEKRIFGRTPH